MREEKFIRNNVRLSYAKEKISEDRGDFWVYYVIRRISFYPTWLFLKLGISANQATYISMVVGVGGCWLLAFGNYVTRVTGALLVNFWIILDCVDGNIARYKETSSDYGEFIDALGGYLLNAILFLFVGIGAFRNPESSFKFANRIFAGNLDKTILVILGAWGSLAVIFSRLIFHKFMNIFSQAKNAETKSEIEFSKGSQRVVYLIAHNIVSFSGFLLPILFMAVIFRLLAMFVFLYALMNTIILIVMTYRVVLKSQKLESQKS